MTEILSRFRIEALHNVRNIDVPITDNKLVLVGENGTGKSTVVNLITFFLTRQWQRMLNYEFRRIEAERDIVKSCGSARHQRQVSKEWA